ncbi:predicted protein [Chaetomium globosum CBS 148.51]|uniref:Uncharacterized protein n=1 Tax=Chaetomium globosum (strain ATCC 6205 / CBS 148.51 / DSM 1962 / NBRC 6347 / NRRL 1970) TaxID=306901 RepID=Q2H9J9_CHAGB|nr:uncharacterized protein CHGG_03105 [Chaetomium globosum CBS 148.51]EAQ91170.1 predicted protein [Chaetomium globosum CBS 148.51]
MWFQSPTRVPAHGYPTIRAGTGGAATGLRYLGSVYIQHVDVALRSSSSSHPVSCSWIGVRRPSYRPARTHRKRNKPKDGLFGAAARGSRRSATFGRPLPFLGKAYTPSSEPAKAGYYKGGTGNWSISEHQAWWRSLARMGARQLY